MYSIKKIEILLNMKTMYYTITHAHQACKMSSTQFQIFIPVLHHTISVEQATEYLNSSLNDEEEGTVSCDIKAVTKGTRRFAFVKWDNFPETEMAQRFKAKIERDEPVKLVYDNPRYFMCCKMNEREKPIRAKPYLDLE